MSAAGLNLDTDQIERLWAFHAFLRERNKELNMSRIHNFENIVLKHYVDSILVGGLMQLPSPLLDIGSGPGFPGIPLKIAYPDLHLVLAEGRAKRVEFLRETIARLGLEGIEVYGHKVSVPHNPGADLDITFRGVITRALEEIGATLRRVLPFLPFGGRVLLMKGPDCDAELAEVPAALPEAYRLIDDRAYELPDSPHRRRLVVFERTAAPAPALDSVSVAQDSGRGFEVGVPAERLYSGPIREITSATNSTFKRFASLLTGRGIRKNDQALIAGTKPVAEVLRCRPDLCHGWITSTGDPEPPPARPDGVDLKKPQSESMRSAGSVSGEDRTSSEQDAPSPLVWYRLAPELYRELDVSGTAAPLLLTDLIEIPIWSDIEWPSGCTLFVPFQDPDNVGAVIRTAAAFGVSRVVLLAEAAHPFLPKSQRAAGSALFHVPLLRGPSIRELQTAAAPLLALSAEGRDIADCAFPQRFGLLVGVEGPGLPERFRGAETLSIPMTPGTESLNAAAAAAVALYAWRLAEDVR